MPKPSVLPATRLASELDAESFDTNVEAPVVPSREVLLSAEVLRVKLLTQTAKAPVRGSPLSAGFDLSASEACVIKAGERGIVKTGLQISIPVGCYGRVAPRSGLAVKKFIDTGAGVIDADYRGEVGVVLFNFGKEDFQVDIGDRVAQLVLERICMAPVQVVDELDLTDRGSGGFGSTGLNGKPQK